ncbi:MAG TPA: glutathione S-transferase family protein [Aliidongia sp.]|uniref:glutathione S-transferase family protein n=1 Tax=Aliidongia sp. TaxID=1914230 RepID=UPI002DDD186C|nr:glutathione S-transferase family protein [Aliidongia sp.]HEV2676996.1 glutathione S-transferase family protein [Aliidongia sp.]
MSVKLYGIPGSPYVQATMLALTEKGVDYELVKVMPPEHKGAEHLARHPFGKVPAFDHDGFALYETQAILRYVDQAFPGPLLEPATPQEAARMNQVIGLVDCYIIRAWSADISFERIMAPRFFGRPCNEAKVEAALPHARICAEAVEALVTGPYLTGPTLTLADLHLAPHYNYFRQTPEGEATLADKPRLAQWFAHLSQRESVKALLPD